MAANPIHPANPLDPAAAPSAAHHGVGHVVSPKILIATALALLVLTVITVAIAHVDFENVDLAELNIFFALLVAVIKGSLVCLFFMHLRWDRPFNAFVMVASLGFVALFIGFAMTDSSEYQHEVIKGDTAPIRAKLELLQTEPATDAGHGAAPNGAQEQAPQTGGH